MYLRNLLSGKFFTVISLSRFRQISSVSPPNHYRTEESSSTESYSAYHHLLTQTVTSHQNLRNSSPQFAHSDLHNHHDAPLNLSLTNSSANSNSPSQSRPSVITCAPLATNGRYENGSNGSPSPSGRREVNSGLYLIEFDLKILNA